MSFFLRFGFLVFAMLLMACGKDELVNVGSFDLSFSAQSGLEKTIKPLETFRTTIVANGGAEKLKGLLITQNGEPMPFAKIKINTKPIEGNPYIVYPPDDGSFRYSIEITAPDQTGTYEYGFKVVDFGNEAITIVRKITVIADKPILKYNGPELNIVKKGTAGKYKLNGSPKDGKLKKLEVLINGLPINAIDFVSFGSQIPTSNPFDLDIGFLDGFDRDLVITAPLIAGNYTYVFVLTDEYGESARDSAYTLVGEPAMELVTKDLYNRARNSQSGALSLLTGIGGSPDTLTGPLLIDLGIELGNDDPESNWLRQIKGSAGVEIRYLKNGKNGLPQVFTYQKVETQEQIALLFEDNGIPFTLKDKSGTLVSDPMQIGQILAVKSGTNKYFLLETVLVNSNPSDNSDFYRFNIKF